MRILGKPMMSSFHSDLLSICCYEYIFDFSFLNFSALFVNKTLRNGGTWKRCENFGIRRSAKRLPALLLHFLIVWRDTFFSNVECLVVQDLAKNTFYNDSSYRTWFSSWKFFFFYKSDLANTIVDFFFQRF